MPWARSALAPLLVACAACGPPASTPADARETRIDWITRLDRDHPLVGRIWNVAARSFATERELLEALARSRRAVLGEKHDNPDHHRLQARLLEGLLARERRPALVAEMIDQSLQPELARVRAEHPRDADAIAGAVDWAESGWPPWETYRPVFAVAAQADLPIVAAGLSREAAMRLVHGDAQVLDPELVRRFALDAKLPESEEAPLREEMRAAHCGMLPSAMLAPMVLIQRARDALLADRLQAASARDGAVLIAGNGHARNDRGVPAQLARALSLTALSVGLLEVHAGLDSPQAYAAAFDAEALPFDYVWFTPRASDADPCEALRGRGEGAEGETESETDPDSDPEPDPDPDPESVPAPEPDF